MTPAIELPWLPASLSGHAKGNWRYKSSVTKTYRNNACLIAKSKWRGLAFYPGDIHFEVTFYPPNRKSDRVNYPVRMKPYYDGIADALGVNDSRFAIPIFRTCEPSKTPKVLVKIAPECLLDTGKNAIKRASKTGVNAPASTNRPAV
jgi:Holliday junction resolvase RusA-like endonuclease